MSARKQPLGPWAPKAIKLLGRFALVIALLLMTLEMFRVWGWFTEDIGGLIATMGWSAQEFWATVANVSVTLAFLMLIIGMAANRLSRSRVFVSAEAAADTLDSKAVLERIRADEDPNLSAGDA